ncbi:hypothetical protein N2603_38375 [Bradyrhizobium huanghuaihaiense]|uniref:hypothetical protein n=1 Tax=Bradyrhizobium huanghuaihaiense TaxID=990078 RepID=UPI0021AADF95|nr:hypothetical protein [Bradyrhizobium sp. CB3035]UWU81606.1 hypothetical protein N2603_38375 [Bradyrhizobium sp. CB3035]
MGSRVIRDINRKIEGCTDLLGVIVLGHMLALARRVLDQEQHQRGPNIYSLHAGSGVCRAAIWMEARIAACSDVPDAPLVASSILLPSPGSDPAAQPIGVSSAPTSRSVLDRALAKPTDR